MKISKIILTGVIATAFTSGAFAQAEPVAVQAEATEIAIADTASLAMANEGVKEAKEVKEIKISELPQAVQQSLKTDLYKGWKATRAWIVQKDKKNLYKVEVANEEDKTQNLLFDENGIAID